VILCPKSAGVSEGLWQAADVIFESVHVAAERLLVLALLEDPMSTSPLTV
jgi:hypothetical protein